MALNKEKLQEYYENLEKSYSDYMTAHRQWKNGSNSQKRDAGLEEAELIIARVQRIIESEKLLFDLALLPGNYYDGFMSIRYFHRDMPLFLKRIYDSLNAFN